MMGDHHVKLKVSSGNWKRLRRASDAIDGLLSPRDICDALLAVGLRKINLDNFANTYAMELRRKRVAEEKIAEKPTLLGPDSRVL